MTPLIETIFSDQLIHAISNTILHSIWQGSLIAIFMFVYLRSQKESSAALKHRIAVAALLLTFSASVFTFLFYMLQPGIESSAGSGFSSISNISSAAIVPIVGEANQWSIATFMDVNYYRVAITWIVGVILFSIRLVGGGLHLRSIRQSLDYQLPEGLIAKSSDIANTLGVTKDVMLAYSDRVSVPMMMGYFKPVIVLPMSIINSLSPDEMEAILVHELAHILRSDFAQNVFVVLMESFFFYHPAVWFITSVIKAERESACDEIALKLFPNRMHYARTLVKLEELQDIKTPVMAMSSINNKNSLMKRVKRILNQTDESTYMREKGWAALFLLCSVITLTSASGTFNMERIEGLMSIEKLSTQPIVLNNVIPAIEYISNDSENEDLFPAVPGSEEVLISDKVQVFPASTELSSNDFWLKRDHQSFPSLSRVSSSLPLWISPRDTIDEEELRARAKELRTALKAKRKEIASKKREIKEKVREMKEKIERENEGSLKQLRKEMKEKSKELRKALKAEGKKDGKVVISDGDKLVIVSDGVTEEIELGGGDIWEVSRLGDELALLGSDLSGHILELHEDVNVFDARGNSFSYEVDDLLDRSRIVVGELSDDITELGSDVATFFTDSDFAHTNFFELADDEDHDLHIGTYFSHRSDMKNEIISNLKEDNLLKAKGKNTFKLTDKELKVNGKKQSMTMRDKYEKIARRYNDDAFTVGETKVELKFEMDNEGKSKSTNLSVTIDN